MMDHSDTIKPMDYAVDLGTTDCMTDWARLDKCAAIGRYPTSNYDMH